MTYCADITKCSFYNEYKKRQQDPEYPIFALRGIVNLYCNGMRQGQCMRKKINRILGNDKVPANMMPLGKPISGTTDSAWSREVRSIVR